MRGRNCQYPTHIPTRLPVPISVSTTAFLLHLRASLVPGACLPEWGTQERLRSYRLQQSSPLMTKRVSGNTSAACPRGWDNLKTCSTQYLRVPSRMEPHIHRSNLPTDALRWLPSLLGLTFALHCQCFLPSFSGKH